MPIKSPFYCNDTNVKSIKNAILALSSIVKKYKAYSKY